MCSKSARIRPQRKKSGLNPDILKTYRLVSNLPFISNILEKVVDTRIEHHFVSNCPHEPFHAAYRTFQTIEMTLLKVNNDILESLDQGIASVLVMLELTAAFDTIDHQTLLQRLERNI